MDLEVPHPTYTTTPQGGFLRAARARSAAAPSTMMPTAATVRIPSAAARESSATPAYFQRFWDVQLDVMRQRLRNLEEIPLSSMTSGKSKSTSHHRDMSMVENDSSVMVTKAFRSDEYAYVRMTLLKGKHSHVFTSVWYPTSPNLPILACDLLQFGGSGQQQQQQQQRHLCIVDYQPVIVPLATGEDADADATTATKITQHAQDINNKVGSIRSEYPGLHGEMSKRFYPEGSPYFSRQMLLGRHVKAPATATSPVRPHNDEPAVPSYQSADEMVHDVYEAYQLYMGRHVSWTQQQQQDDANVRNQQQQQVVQQQELEQMRIERHSNYDKFSSKYDPALPMLSHMYGSDFADAYVHDVLFPLSRP
jgi:Ferredoxin-dependent bilin reductase